MGITKVPKYGKAVANWFKSKSKNSPFDKKPSQGKVIKTICSGEVSYAA